MSAVGCGEEGGDLAHDFVGVALEGFVAVLFGERREGEGFAEVDVQVEFLEVFEPVGDDGVFGAVDARREDGDARAGGQVRRAGFAREERMGLGAGALGGDDEQAALFEFGVHVLEEAYIGVIAVNPQEAGVVADPAFDGGAFVFVGDDDDQVFPLGEVVE